MLETKGLNQVHTRLKPNMKIILPTPTQWVEILLEGAIEFHVPAIKQDILTYIYVHFHAPLNIYLCLCFVNICEKLRL